MRTRQQIEESVNDAKEYDNTELKIKWNTDLIVELLLDIRDKLK